MQYEPPVTGSGLTLSHGFYEANLPFHEFLPFLIDDYNASSERDESCQQLLKVEPTIFKSFPKKKTNLSRPDTWVSLAELGIERHCGGARPTSVDNTTFFFGRDCADMWIVRLNPSN